MPEERESDLLSIADMWGKPQNAWPPSELAPGIALRRIPIPQHATELRQALPGKTTFLVPAIVDERAYYQTIMLHNYREEDEQLCPVCKGARYLRYERPPGHLLFAQLTPCKACFKPRPPVEKPKATGRKAEPWWSK